MGMERLAVVLFREVEILVVDKPVVILSVNEILGFVVILVFGKV
jgi:hypothetical protein